MNNKIIFLDVDGVLNNGTWAEEMYEQGVRVYHDDILYEPSLEYCDRCGLDNAKIHSMTQIYSLPPVLMIIFNRGKGLQYDIKINFQPLLDLSQIALNCDKIYELQCVIKHLGDNSPTGHFIAYCRSPVPNFQNNWYCYNDNTVVQVNDWNSILNGGNIYIVFYQLKNN